MQMQNLFILFYSQIIALPLSSPYYSFSDFVFHKHLVRFIEQLQSKKQSSRHWRKNVKTQGSSFWEKIACYTHNAPQCSAANRDLWNRRVQLQNEVWQTEQWPDARCTPSSSDPGSCYFVCKRDFGDGIDWRNFEIGSSSLDYPGGPNVIRKVLTREEEGGKFSDLVQGREMWGTHR